MNEFEIYQNRIIGSIMLWEFARMYEVYNTSASLTIMHAFPVLPICMNRRIVNHIKRKQLNEGSLIKVLTEHGDIFAGLNEKVIQFSDLTFQSLYLAHSLKLLQITDGVFIKTKNLNPRTYGSLDFPYKKEVNNMAFAARRLGAWFGKLSFEEINEHFGLNY